MNSQYAAERNAQQAMIALAKLRREQEDVERFLAAQHWASQMQTESGIPLPPPISFVPMRPTFAIGANPTRLYGSAASRALANGMIHRRSGSALTGLASGGSTRAR